MARSQDCEAEFVRVFCRVRPSKEAVPRNILDLLPQNRIQLVGVGEATSKIYDFEGVFGETSLQEAVYAGAADRIIRGCLDGYNGTVFAYGQTGSGKTHTMLGPSIDGRLDRSKDGLIPRALLKLFTCLEDRKAQTPTSFNFSVKVSFVELYNENIFDLLDGGGEKLRLRHDRDGSVYIAGASEEFVSTSIDAMRVVERGWEQRRVAETAMNRESSRSHAILCLHVSTDVYENGMEMQRKSCLHLVDLAGSERQTHSKTEGSRLKESSHINKSLTVLGRVIRVLSEPLGEKTHVPYRDSLLTHILKDSLGGSARTAVVVNVHPDLKYLAETHSTLQFAQSVRLIKNTLIANEDLKGESVLAYRNEIIRLTTELAKMEAEKEQDLAKVSAEVRMWKEKAVCVERQLSCLHAQYRSLYLLHHRKEDENVDFEAAWNDTLRIVHEGVSSSLSTPTATVQSFELRHMQDRIKQYEFEKKEAELREERLRNEVKVTKEKLNEVLSQRLSPAPTPISQRENERERRRRRQTLLTPRHGARPSALFRPVHSLFSTTEEADEAEEEEIRRESEEERRLLKLEMDNNSLNQIVQATEEAHRQLTVLLSESTEREQKATSERERAEQRAAEAEMEVEKALDRVEKAEDNAARLRQELSVSADQVVQLERRAACLEESLVECRSELQRAIDDSEVKQQLLREEMKKIRDEEHSDRHKQQLLTHGEMQKLKDEKKRLERAKLEAENAKKEAMDVLAGLNADKLAERRKRKELEEELESTKREHSQHLVALQLEYRSRFSDIQKERNEMELQLRTKDAELSYEGNRRVEAEAETTRRVARLNQEWEKRLEEAESAYQSTMDQYRHYVDQNSAEFETKMNQMRAEFGVEVKEKDEKISQLNIELQVLKGEKENDDRVVSGMLGHNNKQQKLNMVQKYRDELFELKKENGNLKKENHELKADAMRASGGAAQPARMVTRALSRSRQE